MSLHDEILEQPSVLRKLLESQRQPVEAMVEAVAERRIRSVFIAARGSSDNAALYAKYLLGAVNRMPVALAAPSLFTTYRSPPDLGGSLVVGISQSGQSPDIVSVLSEARRQGVLTLAITNDPGSPLAETADLLLDTRVGVERAIAATKTYTAQLMAIALLSSALDGAAERVEELAKVPAWVEEMLELDARIAAAAQRYRYMSQCVVLGRGYNYATAYEWSLKLEELTYVVAEPYSSADFQHGPVAIVSHGFPVLAVAPAGEIFDDLLQLLQKLAAEHRAELVVLSNEAAALELGRTSIELPEALPEWLSPLVAIVPAQLFCYHLTRAMGYDTESPRRLSKITRTW